ncbi:hypothetical protein [Mycobacteroides franklinii]|uniref:Uncharacterized protein n=1 Tax=Mycobacteroides franklinii TaxID=948102 RepID=A0A4R5P5U1_9MYCO|nr:hypothetical protein [Mycobacteroides franklinii]ORA61003.1 hypothetical protein BST24_12635 [Mycobacteroides franklinii]TDH18021.1 hypothetical protein EJ571_25175 [Mycobacteroides franklinii]
MVEHFEAAGNLFVIIPRTWEQAKMSLAVLAVFGGVLSAIFSWKEGLASVYGKALGGIGLGAIILGAMGILLTLKQTSDSTGLTTGGISFNGEKAAVVQLRNGPSGVDLENGHAVLQVAA